MAIDMGFKTVHMSQSVTGPLRNWTRRDWQRATKWIHRNDGSTMTADELKNSFLKMLSEGIECFPIGECDNFDYKSGCKGHPQTGEEKV